MEVMGKRFYIILAGMAFFSVDAHAGLDSFGLMDNVIKTYTDAVVQWEVKISNRAHWLFWTLATISLVWTFALMALRKADMGEFFAELVRFTIFIGFFLWLLDHGPVYARSIIDSLEQIGGEAGNVPDTLTPSGIVDIGFKIFDQMIDSEGSFSNVLVGMIIATIILVVLALISVNMLLLLISGWILAYAGIFFLGFGGSRWTSDMAINYYRTVLGVGIQLFAMILLIGIGQKFISDYYAKITPGHIVLREMAVMLIASVVLLVLTNKVPQLLSGIITGAGVGHSGIGNFGAGAVVGAATAAGAAVSTAASMIGGAAAGTAGAHSAVKAAYEKAQQSIANGVGSSGGGAGSGGGSDGQAGAEGRPKPSLSAVARELGKGVKGAIGKSISDSGKETFVGKVAEAIRKSGKPKEDQDDAGTLSGPQSSGDSQGAGNAAPPGSES